MRKVIIAIGALLGFGMIPMLMGPTGGYPFNPTFGSAVIQVLNIAAAGNPDLKFSNASAGVDAKNSDTYVDSSGTQHYRLINDARSVAPDWLTITRSGTAMQGVAFSSSYTAPALSLGNGTANVGLTESGNISYIGSFSNSVVNLMANNASIFALTPGGGLSAASVPGGDKGSGTINAAGLYVNGVAASVGTTISIDFTTAAGGVTVNTCNHCGTSSGVRNSIGNYTINYGVAVSAIPSCTPRNNTSAPGTISIGSVSSGSFTVITYNTASTLWDSSFSIDCTLIG